MELAQKNKIIVIAHTPLARGDSKGDDSLLKDETVLDIAAKHGRTPAQVVLKSTIARGIGVIPKTGNIPRMQENWLSWTLELQDDDIKKIKTLNKNNRVCDGTSFATQFAMFD